MTSPSEFYLALTKSVVLAMCAHPERVPALVARELLDRTIESCKAATAHEDSAATDEPTS